LWASLSLLLKAFAFLGITTPYKLGSGNSPLPLGLKKLIFESPKLQGETDPSLRVSRNVLGRQLNGRDFADDPA
jgi:hypothetical protein